MPDLISTLIEQIAPLNNQYREGIRSNQRGEEILKIMWDIGEILVNNNVKNVHTIAWKIYGKEKGLRRSYITRDFLSYCFRIRRFHSRESIEQQFPSLQRYSLFREAFPLLENPKYALDKEEREKLIKLLNSNFPFSKIKKEVIKIKRERIQIYNDRRQRLHEMENLRILFIRIYNELYNLIATRNLKEAIKIRRNVGNEFLFQLSQLCLAFTQEGLSFPTIDKNKLVQLDEDWQELFGNLVKLSQSNIEARNRFRRVIPTSKIMELAEMLNAIVDDEDFMNLKEKLVKIMK
jgi:hypothetical protein